MSYMYESFRCPICGNIIPTSAGICNCCGAINVRITVGRYSCDINIDDFAVSRHHLDIVYTRHQTTSFYTIISYGINGTIVNGRVLHNGDTEEIPDIGQKPFVMLAGKENAILDWKEVDRIIKQKERAYGVPCQTKEDHMPSRMPRSTASRTSILLKVLSAPIAIIAAPISIIATGINSVVDAVKDSSKRRAKQEGVSYRPASSIDKDFVYSSIFAPAEVKRKFHMQVQVYLHLFGETEKVKTLAQESDKNAERRDYIPLQCKLKKGDKVDVQLNIYGEALLISDKKSAVWQGSFTKCSFDYFVPRDIDVDELSCVAMLTVNGVPVGEMRFITRIVDAPRQLNPEIIAHKYNKVFISYSHQDESKVKFLHEGLELGAVPHFFDRKYLKAGDVFPQVIQDYINSADLFILCWSENASKSEYVQKERLQALERAFPQVKPEQAAKLRIYPMSIEPRAELPTDMKNNYHFGEL